MYQDDDYIAMGAEIVSDPLELYKNSDLILKVKEPITTPNKILIDGYGNQKFNEESKEKYAYPIDNVYEIKQPIKLDELREKFNFTAPQSFAYGEKYQSLLKHIRDVGVNKIY